LQITAGVDVDDSAGRGCIRPGGGNSHQGQKPDVPSALGVPVKFPFVLSVSPAGRVPVVKLQS
jgi:hypothetical protein